jgi:hypothetical protein
MRVLLYAVPRGLPSLRGSVLSWRPSLSTTCPAAFQNLLTLRRSNLRYSFALRESFFFPQTPGALHLLTGNVTSFLISKKEKIFAIIATHRQNGGSSYF